MAPSTKYLIDSETLLTINFIFFTDCIFSLDLSMSTIRAKYQSICWWCNQLIDTQSICIMEQIKCQFLGLFGVLDLVIKTKPDQRKMVNKWAFTCYYFRLFTRFVLHSTNSYNFQLLNARIWTVICTEKTSLLNILQMGWEINVER